MTAGKHSEKEKPAADLVLLHNVSFFVAAPKIALPGDN